MQNILLCTEATSEDTQFHIRKYGFIHKVRILTPDYFFSDQRCVGFSSVPTGCTYVTVLCTDSSRFLSPKNKHNVC
jgi:hypothetical protein